VRGGGGGVFGEEYGHLFIVDAMGEEWRMGDISAFMGIEAIADRV
jgi:hypothetical protein